MSRCSAGMIGRLVGGLFASQRTAGELEGWQKRYHDGASSTRRQCRAERPLAEQSMRLGGARRKAARPYYYFCVCRLAQSVLSHPLLHAGTAPPADAIEHSSKLSRCSYTDDIHQYKAPSFSRAPSSPPLPSGSQHGVEAAFFSTPASANCTQCGATALHPPVHLRYCECRYPECQTAAHIRPSGCSTTAYCSWMGLVLLLPGHNFLTRFPPAPRPGNYRAMRFIIHSSADAAHGVWQHGILHHRRHRIAVEKHEGYS